MSKTTITVKWTQIRFATAGFANVELIGRKYWNTIVGVTSLCVSFFWLLYLCWSTNFPILQLLQYFSQFQLVNNIHIKSVKRILLQYLLTFKWLRYAWHYFFAFHFRNDIYNIIVLNECSEKN